MLTPLYIIPARGGSKGIPGKNIKPLDGRPLIWYSIDVARALAPDAAHIILSTDSADIRECAERYGLPVPYRRPAALATDTAGSREVMLDAMDWATARGIDYDTVVLLQPTSPLRRADDVRRCLQLLEERPDADMAVTVTQAADNPYYNCYLERPDGTLRIALGDGLITRRQDAPQAWTYNGAVYAMRPGSLRRYPLGLMPVRLPVAMPRERSIDLDDMLAWVTCEVMMREPGLLNR